MSSIRQSVSSQDETPTSFPGFSPTRSRQVGERAWERGRMKLLEVRQKYSAACGIFKSLLSVLSGDKTLRPVLDILHKAL